jgi:DNA repair photolyase
VARVEYREMQCKSVLNRVRGMPFPWSINPYRGCVHSCHYCYARGTHTYLDLNIGDDFSGIIFAKINAPQVLHGELSRPSWRHEKVSIGTATDPYQPAEGRFRLTRAILEVLDNHHTPVSIVTKGPLIVRDRDLLAAMAKRAGCTVCLSIPTVDRTIWRATEPGTAPPAQRLRVLEQLSAAGIHAGVLAAPILPGLSSAPEQLEAMVKAAAEHGARFLWADLLHLNPLIREHYLGFLDAEYPELTPLHVRLYPGPYAPRMAAANLKSQVAEFKERYGLVDRKQDVQRPKQMEMGFSPS